jgi:hypothetical protein
MSGFRIQQVWAFVAIDSEDGDEGIIGHKLGDSWLPFVAADEDRVRSLKPMAALISRTLGVEVRLVRFDQRTDVEVLEWEEP